MPDTAPYRLISSETKPLTPELVAEQLALPASPTERMLSKKRVTFLRGRFDAGLFHPPHWVQALVASQRMRANGMHSATMLSELNGNFPTDMKVHIDLFECKDMDSLAMLFQQFDARQSARTPDDIAGAYQGLRAELNPVGRRVGKLGVEAVAWYRQWVSEKDKILRGDDRYVLFNEQEIHPYLLWIGELFGEGKVPAELALAPVFAAMYATYESDRDAADDFWREVTEDGRDGAEDNFPTNRLAEWLKEVHAGDFEVKPRGLYQGCIYVWNAMREGKTSISSIKCDIKKSLYKVR